MKFFKKNLDSFILSSIVVLGLSLFFYKLSQVPSGFYIDEALPGYNAYSILKTGKDEFGKAFPIYFRFYGLYNPPLFIYSTIVPIAIFGLNVFSVRFMSSLAGLLSVIPFYFLLKESGRIKNKLSLYFCSLLFIVQPWLILHSRVGYEVSLAFLIYSLAVLYLWFGLKKKKFLISSFALFSLSIHAAYAERYLAPLLILGFIFVFRKKLSQKKAKTQIIKGLILAIVIQIPLLTLIATPAFFPKSDMLTAATLSHQVAKIPLPHVLSLPLVFLREFLSQYVTYFSPRSLFFLPDPDLQRSIPELSALYFWMIIPYLVGIFFLWKERKNSFSKLLLLLFILSPIPASLTHDPFATHRAMPHFLPVMLVISLGMDRLASFTPKKVYQSAFFGLVLFSLLLLWRSYFILFPKERAKVWSYGHQELAEEITKRPNTKFVIDQSRIKPSYINLAFFLRYPPDQYQAEGDQSIKNRYYDNTGFFTDRSFGNIENRNIVWEKDVFKEQVLVGDEYAISPQQQEEHFLEKIFEIRSPVNEIIFVGYKTNPSKKCKDTLNNIHCMYE